MKQHSSELKEKIKLIGRELRSKVTYDNVTLEEELYSASPVFETNLLKSVMKQLEIESSVSIPRGTIINYQLGIRIAENNNENDFEYLDFGNYIVEKIEKQEDTNTYIITCYDKMLLAMKTNEQLDVAYPATIKEYLQAICTKLEIDFHNTNFYNQDMLVQEELYLGLNYTYRDILDEISQVVGGNIIINKNDELEVAYINDTEDIIDEEYLKDTNVEFGQKYGPINTIVLSRSAESDNVYLSDEQSVIQYGVSEIKIVDNQIMNFNNRSEFLPGILDALDGLEYYINDFSSTGICYYDPLDMYYIKVGENTYKTILFNDDIEITLGIEENIHTDLPEQSETDYEKADKTDIKINKTNLIVDKQNQQIQSLITQVGDREGRTTSITQDVDTIASKVERTVNFLDTVEGRGELRTLDALPLQVNAMQFTGQLEFKNFLYCGDTYSGDSYSKG